MPYMIYGSDGIVIQGHKGTKILKGIFMIEDDYVVNRRKWENDSRNYYIKALIGYGCDNADAMENVRIDYIVTLDGDNKDVKQLMEDNELIMMKCKAPKGVRKECHEKWAKYNDIRSGI